MKKLNSTEMSSLIGGELTNRQCMILGGLGIGAALAGVYGAAFGIAAGATIGGCFDEW